MAATDEVRMRFDHVSIAVKSIDRAYEFFSKYFPITMRSAKTIDEQDAGSFYWQDFHLGGFVVELIEDPPNNPSFVTQVTPKHRDGMPHLFPAGDDRGPAIAALE